MTWGESFNGGDSTSVSSQLASGVTALYSTASAFAALKSDGSVVTWGDPNYGGALELQPENPPILPATIHVRIAAGAQVGAVSGHLTLASDGVAPRSVALIGEVIPPDITYPPADHSVTGLQANYGSAGSAGFVVIEAQRLVGPLTLTAPAGFEISLNGFTFGPTVSLSPSGGRISSEVYVRIAAGAPVGAVSGHLTLASDGVAPRSVALIGEVIPPDITYPPADHSVTGLQANYGSAGSAGFVVIEAQRLVGPLTLTAPAGFEISLNGFTFGPTVSLSPSGGRISSEVYVRIAAGAPVGAVSGHLTLASDGVAPRSVSLSGSVAARPELTASESWRLQFFGSAENSGNAADLATPDGDGIANLIKYALCLTPGQNGAGSLPKARIATNSGNRYLSLSFRRDPARNDVTILVEVQANLGGAWTEIARSVNGAAFTGPAGVTETDAAGDTKDVEIRDTQTVGSASRRFMRIRAENTQWPY